MSDNTTQQNTNDIVALGDLVNLQVKRLEEQIDALDKLIEARFVTYKVMMESNASQVAIALAASEKAITKAESATDKRFDGVNEFREALTDLGKNMATRRELETAIVEIKGVLESNAAVVAELRSRIDVGPSGLTTLQNQYSAMQGAKKQSLETRDLLFAVLGAVMGIMGFIIGG